MRERGVIMDEDTKTLSNNKRIVVMGGGIGGLTAAHELSERGYEVQVYEKNSIVGGMARSEGRAFTGNNSHRELPGEYVWHIHGERYSNLRYMMQRIPVDANRTVLDNLSPIRSVSMCSKDGQTIFFKIKSNGYACIKNLKVLLRDWTLSDIAYVLDKLLFSATICDERICSLANVTWLEFVNDNKLSPHVRPYILEMLTSFYGLTYHKASAMSALITLNSLFYYTVSDGSLSVMNAPANDVWMNPWKEYLQKQGVKFYLNHEILSLHPDDKNSINAITVLDKMHNEKKMVTADYFICSLPVEVAARLSKSIDDVKTRAPSLFNLKRLAALSEQCIPGVQFYFDKKMSLEPNCIIWLSDTPWQLIIEPQADFWSIDLSQFGDGNVKQIWSLVVDSETDKGILHKKVVSECTPQEVIEEIWAQVKQSSDILKKLCLMNDINLTELHYTDAFVWHTFQYKNGKLASEEPKFSNNVGTFPLQPNITTEFDNLFFATAYTKVSTRNFSMETAAEAGRRATNAVLMRSSANNKDELCSFFSNDRYPFYYFFLPLKCLDAIAFKLGIPHFSKFTKNTLLLVLIYLVLLVCSGSFILFELLHLL